MVSIERKREISRKYYWSHKKEISERAKNPEVIKRKRGERTKSNQKVRVDVLTHYGNGKLACVRCGFDNILALSIDHIDGNGAKHREKSKQAAKGGISLYYLLRKGNYPSGYQTLCMNCQFIKRRENKEYYVAR